MEKRVKHIKQFVKKIEEDRVSVYAAQTAFYMMLSLIPVFLLLMTMVRYTPVTQTDIMKFAYEVFPKTISSTMISIISEVYSQTSTRISMTFLVAVWSSGKGILAITKGLNEVLGLKETRNYLWVRIRSGFYTVIFLAALILSLVVLGFGNSISLLVQQYIPMIQTVIEKIIEVRTVVAFFMLIAVSVSIYQFLPNRKSKLRYQLPGAVFTAVGWCGASLLFSVYMDIFKGFSNMYGSLTTIVLIMLWLYVCMYVVLLGGEINVFAKEHLDIKN